MDIQAGIPLERAGLMRTRLSHDFSTLARPRFDTLLHEAGLTVRTEFFRAFSTVGFVVEHAGS